MMKVSSWLEKKIREKEEEIVKLITNLPKDADVFQFISSPFMGLHFYTEAKIRKLNKEEEMKGILEDVFRSGIEHLLDECENEEEIEEALSLLYIVPENIEENEDVSEILKDKIREVFEEVYGYILFGARMGELTSFLYDHLLGMSADKYIELLLVYGKKKQHVPYGEVEIG